MRWLVARGGDDKPPRQLSRSGEIYVIEPDGSGERRLTSGRANDVPDGHAQRRLTENGSDPAWSPDGRAIAFERNGDVYVMHADGTRLRRLTRGPSEDGFPGWLPSS
jgi:Tol biopolymer transport system component